VIYVVATGVVVRLAAYQQVEASVPSAGGRGAHSWRRTPRRPRRWLRGDQHPFRGGNNAASCVEVNGSANIAAHITPMPIPHDGAGRWLRQPAPP